MCVPLIDNDTFIGTLTASNQEVNAFDVKKGKMMIIFAEQATLAISHARQAELAHRQANQLEMLMDLSRGITTSHEPNTLYRSILVDVQRLVPCDLATLYMYQEGTQELHPIAELYGADTVIGGTQETNAAEVRMVDLQQEKVRLYDTQSVTAWAAVHKHPMLRTSTAEANTKPEENEDMAELAAPLVSKHVLYGVLSLIRVEAFSSEELRIVRNLGNMAAAALENVELFHKVRTDQEQLRAIVASSSDGIALLGVNSCFIEANEAFGRIFGIEPEQIVGMDCIELLGCEGEEGNEQCRELCMVHAALQQEEPLPYTEVDLTIKGVPRSVGLSITRVSTKGRPICLMMARDVTAIRDATRMKANFISMITHELRSPLNAINGYLDLALSGVAGELNEQLNEFLRRSRAGSEQLYALVEDLLLVSRADAGQLRLSREVISLNDVITDAIEELELTATDKDIALTVDIAKDFPQLYADPVRMQQVLRNLVSNALRFTSTGGSVTVAAKLEYVENGDEETEDRDVRRAKLTVTDTGLGIAPEYQQRIFERFYQVPQTTARTTGQGLGLAIVKMIIELHGGTVIVESVEGQGSTFTCVLPCVLS
jgi:PAS domain S-box-containing protein